MGFLMLLAMIGWVNALSALESLQIHQQCQELCNGKQHAQKTCQAQCMNAIKNRLVLNPKLPVAAREALLKSSTLRSKSLKKPPLKKYTQKVVTQKQSVRGRRVLRSVK
jgi:hypothetical protein